MSDTPASSPGDGAAAPGPSQPQQEAPKAGRSTPLTADQEKLLGELLGKRDSASGQETVRLKVEPPHASVTFGGVTVGSVFTEVPASAAPDLVSEAAAAGVTITQEG